MKNKKSLFVVIVLTIVLAACLTACDLGSIIGHKHNVSYNAWENNDTGHWHACSGCNQRFDYHVHIYETETSTACKECGWLRKVTEIKDPTKPDDGNKKPEGETEKPGGNETEKPGGNETEKPGGNETEQPGGNETEKPGGNEQEPEKPPVVKDKITTEEIAARAASRYGYEWLGRQENGAAMQEFYNKIDRATKKVWDGTVWGNKAQLDKLNVAGTDCYNGGKIESNTLEQSEIEAAYYCYTYDHPYNFWQDQTFVSGCSQLGNDITRYTYVAVLPKYSRYSALTADKTVLDGNIKELYSEATGTKNAYEISAAYYRAIALCATYAYKSDGVTPADEYWAHGIVGIFDNDSSTNPVCEGYARAFQLMLNLKSVDNAYCVGYAVSAGAGGGGGHAWNCVKLEDRKWYWYDLTWDDSNSANGSSEYDLTYEFFAVSQADLPRKYAFTTTHYCGTPQKDYGYFLYDMPTVAATAYSGTTFKLGGKYSMDKDFEYSRLSLDTVSVIKIKTNDGVVKIPETVTIEDRIYTVTEIGPNTYYNNGQLTVGPVLSKASARSIVLPETITAIRQAAFFCNVKMTIYFGGTQTQWEALPKGSDAFAIAPTVYYKGEWQFINGFPNKIKK